MIVTREAWALFLWVVDLALAVTIDLLLVLNHIT